MTHFYDKNKIDHEVLSAIMSTIYYFDIFKHPLRQNELLIFSHNRKIEKKELSNALQFLVTNNHLQEKNGFYLPHKNFENISRRINGELLAEKYWKIARKKSRFISKFPFIRSVLISGSLSKGFMDKKSDIDYLIITKPGRLWLARTLLVLYKKLFLLNSHKFFCVNYFLDLENLVLSDRNLFTATELLFAKPVYNNDIYQQLVQSNAWTHSFYPSLHDEIKFPSKLAINHHQNKNLKSTLEKLLDGKTGDLLDSACMKISRNFWNLKFTNMNKEQYNRDMKTTKGISKHHPNGFRDKILNEHKKKIESFIQKINNSSTISNSLN